MLPGGAARWGLRRPFRQSRPCAAGMAISARDHVNSNTAQLNGALFTRCCRPLPLLFCAPCVLPLSKPHRLPPLTNGSVVLVHAGGRFAREPYRSPAEHRCAATCARAGVCPAWAQPPRPVVVCGGGWRHRRMRHILSPRVGRPIHNHIAHAPHRTTAGGVGPAHGPAPGPLDERLLSRFRARELPGMRPQMPKLDRRHPSKIRPVSAASPPRRGSRSGHTRRRGTWGGAGWRR
eukprot:COSAG01_NODE_1724_length_9382_cov_6.435743_6_plen_234_part_00